MPILKKCFFGLSTSGATGATGITVAALAGNKEVRFNPSKAQVPDSVSGDTIDAMLPGTAAVPVTVVHRQQFGTGGLDETIYGYWNNETALLWEARQSSTGLGGPNPRYRGYPYYIVDITPLDGAHGENLANRLTLVPGTGAVLARATAT